MHRFYAEVDPSCKVERLHSTLKAKHVANYPETYFSMNIINFMNIFDIIIFLKIISNVALYSTFFIRPYHINVMFHKLFTFSG